MKSLKVHSVSQRLNLRHLCKPLRETEGLVKTVGVCDDEQAQMPEGSECHTEGAILFFNVA